MLGLIEAVVVAAVAIAVYADRKSLKNTIETLAQDAETRVELAVKIHEQELRADLKVKIEAVIAYAKKRFSETTTEAITCIEEDLKEIL